MQITIKNNRLSASVSTMGAEIVSLLLDGAERLWQADPAVWGEHAPVLFPIVGRIRDGKYEHEGKTYSIRCPHGFAREKEFSVIEQTSSSVTLRLCSDDQTLAQFPFDFVLEICYSLSGTTLEMTFRIENSGDQTMYYSFGAHPGFRLPPEDGSSFSDWYLLFPGEESLDELTLSGVFLSGKSQRCRFANGNRIPLFHEMFDDDAFLLTGLKNRRVILCSEKSSRRIEVDCSDFDYLAFWHMPKTSAEYLCIEPWNGLPSVEGAPEILSEKKAIRTLLPHGQETASVRFTLE